MKFGSLFSGVGGFDLGLELAGMECAWQCENDRACRSVLDYHWPDVPKYDDVRGISYRHGKGWKRHKHPEPVDLIVGGFPCQGLSVAGLRKGLQDPRSGLWFEFYRIIKEARPQYVLIENVPGLLISNDRQDIQVVLDSLAGLGYVVDIDILDAQFFGVAQRRRRVFIWCVRLDALLLKRTNISRQISADLVAQTLRDIWGAIPQAWSAVPLPLDSERRTEQCVVLLQKRMALSKTTLKASAFKISPNGLDVLLVQFTGEGKSWACSSVERNERIVQLSQARVTCESLLMKTGNDAGHLSISTWLSNLSDDVCEAQNKSIISTLDQQTTDWTIFTFSVMALHTITRILLSLDWSVNCWSVVQSVSTVLQESMNYARQAVSWLFITDRLRDSWRDYLHTASIVQSIFERCLGDTGGLVETQPNQDTIRLAELYPEILFESDGCARDSTPGREKGKKLARPLAHSTTTNHYDPSQQTYVIAQNGSDIQISEQPGAVSASYAKQTSGDLVAFDRTKGTMSGKISAPLRACGAQADGVNDAKADTQCIAFTERSRDEGRTVETQDELSYALTDPAGGGKAHCRSIAGSFGVRRLTPTECERLQNFPDEWALADRASDSARYRQMGNAVCVAVSYWLGARIIKVDLENT